MKTLEQVEPRRPISTVPFSITEPGAYYLTTNLLVAGVGISILTNDVSIDLNGFTITGDGDLTDYAISTAGATRLRNVSIRNGKFFNIGGAFATIGVGLDNLLVESIQAQQMIRGGVWIGHTSDGIVVRDSVFVDCSTPLRLTGFSGQNITGATFSNNRIVRSSGGGIDVNAQSGGSVRDVSILNNQITAASASCIDVTSATPGGVQRVLIDSNHCTRDSAIGIIVDANCKATVVRNVFTGCTMSVSGTGNTVGPVISTTGVLGTTGAAMSPWANFVN